MHFNQFFTRFYLSVDFIRNVGSASKIYRPHLRKQSYSLKSSFLFCDSCDPSYVELYYILTVYCLFTVSKGNMVEIKFEE